ncbi:hypothetical protein FRB94_005600 [Tulasnella sp. JGI-2019a]|nr:hypothetical protein FRB94_005600 [Tulasnella sp. JGI-2019a]KAG9004339.1 hypothetical protein FRB93_010409 [Tulasnella sp. JGI-2019a]
MHIPRPNDDFVFGIRLVTTVLPTRTFANSRRSIYSDEFAQYFPNLKEQHAPLVGRRGDSTIIKSNNAEQLKELEPEEFTCLRELVDAPAKGAWKIRRGHAAILVLIMPRTIELPREVLDRLAETPMLKDFHLVTTVFKCPAYAFYLSDKYGDEVSLALINSLPIPGDPVVAGNGVHIGNWRSDGGGFAKYGGRKGGKDDSTPVFTLEKIRRPCLDYFRRETSPSIQEFLPDIVVAILIVVVAGLSVGLA